MREGCEGDTLPRRMPLRRILFIRVFDVFPSACLSICRIYVHFNTFLHALPSPFYASLSDGSPIFSCGGARVVPYLCSLKKNNPSRALNPSASATPFGQFGFGLGFGAFFQIFVILSLVSVVLNFLTNFGSRDQPRGKDDDDFDN